MTKLRGLAAPTGGSCQELEIPRSKATGCATICATMNPHNDEKIVHCTQLDEDDSASSIILIEAMEEEIGFAGVLQLILMDPQFNLSSSNPARMMNWIRLGFKKISPNDVTTVTMLLDLSKISI
ncbi:hypothetical protein Pmar_PMAR023902 [Perkinsus marinus ATCC 50983]|uniref:Uncharacterized protein n=1 Tax=Perkinsus marinus (strain ATCC 50983 / TXsc) TaxID=423536 RepID=C5LRF9_PERM5|nr:hypothetical protein Pmar_PMAR023902 [Perkinsus marinus ATCC 50983]EER00691.1 hypothetical protein Pmar_PMAR023902 [Perkinsus marinus ATCC 50983]|eukprot:XP_002767973.1 hypothetical protein Pmar_PMAR023902 [Perkinsus marinus ATCC 50983]